MSGDPAAGGICVASLFDAGKSMRPLKSLFLAKWFVVLVLGGFVLADDFAGMWQVADADVSDTQQRCLALALYWEAREEGREGMVAVAWTILNRRHSSEFPHTICAIVKEGGEKPPCQFSFWCDGEPDDPQDASAWKLAREVAKKMLTQPPRDPTDGALFFHSVEVPNPWGKERTRTVKIGNHVFYR